jgi:transcriptional regulator with XRE-family HTH domain
MKVQRKILGISQAQLAEKVDTSTHYIGMIESEKKFPTPEMLERIAAALAIDAPALFSTKSYPTPEPGTMAEFQEQLINDITQVLTYRIGKLNRKIPQDSMSDTGREPKMAGKTAPGTVLGTE